MAAFNYTGYAQFLWADSRVTRQFIDWNGGTDMLTVWPADQKLTEPEYYGQMKDYPAEHIKFLHTNRTTD